MLLKIYIRNSMERILLEGTDSNAFKIFKELNGTNSTGRN